MHFFQSTELPSDLLLRERVVEERLRAGVRLGGGRGGAAGRVVRRAGRVEHVRQVLRPRLGGDQQPERKCRVVEGEEKSIDKRKYKHIFSFKIK